MILGIAVTTPGLIDEATVGTLTGASAAISALTVVVRRVLGINHPGVPAACAFAISFALA